MKAVHFDARPLAAAFHDGVALVLAGARRRARCSTHPPLSALAVDALHHRRSRWRCRCRSRSTSSSASTRASGATRACPTSSASSSRCSPAPWCISIALRRGRPRRAARLPRVPALSAVPRSRSCPARAWRYRSFKEWSLYGRGGEQGTPGGRAWARATPPWACVKELSRSHDWRVVGLLDDDAKQARAPAARRARAGRARGPAALRAAPEGAPRDHRHALGALQGAPARGRDLQARARVGDDGAHAQQRGAAARCAPGAHPQGRGRGPDEARPGDARRRGPARAAHRPGGDGHRRGRLDRLGAVPPDRRLPARDARALRAERVRDVQGRRGSCARAFPEIPVASVIGDVKNVRAREPGDAPVLAGARVPRRGLQARAADGRGQRLGGGAEQRARHLRRGARRDRLRREEVRLRLHRQGGEPDQRDGRHQAPGRDGLPGAAGRAAPRASRWCASATCSAAPAA